MAMAKISIECYQCGTTTEKDVGEYNRSKKMARKMFCSTKCSATHGNLICPRNNVKNLVGKGRGTDEFSCFRWFLRGPRKRNKEFNITIHDLKRVWEKQSGICPLTGWKLVLPETSVGFDNDDRLVRASLDRIDNNKGYVVGNIRFVSLPANLARNNFEDDDLLRFCEAVVRRTVDAR